MKLHYALAALAAGTFSLSAAAQNLKPGLWEVTNNMKSASGEMEIKQVQLKDVVKRGRHEFRDATIVYPALSDIGNVGVKTLSQFAITFDQKNERVRLKP